MRTLLSVILSGALSIPIAAMAAGADTFAIWPDNAPGVTETESPEKWDYPPPVLKVTQVTEPTLTVFVPDQDKNNGAAVIVCPGGGFNVLMMDYEGEDVARWLRDEGFTTFVLKYRVPAPEGQPRWLPALQDGQRAVSLVRSRAAEWAIDPNRIGMLGFSAGAHLSVATATHFHNLTYPLVDEVDAVSSRPNFCVVVYPGGMLNAAQDDLGDHLPITGATPPMFIVQSHEDRVNSENSIHLYLHLKRAGVPAEMHIYAVGKHGFGIRSSPHPHGTWPQRCIEWMADQGITGNTSILRPNP